MASPHTPDADLAVEVGRLCAANHELADEVRRLCARNAELEAALSASAVERAELAATAAAAQRDGEERFRALFETMAQGVVYQAADGQIIACNQAAERILGLTRAQLLGRTSVDPRWRAIHEDGAPFPGEAHPAMVALRTGQAVRNVVMGIYHWQHEAYRWISVSAVPQVRPDETGPTQVYTSFEDITERVQAEESLRASHARLQALGERLVMVQEEERRHLARELHDQIGQTLTGLNLILSMGTALPPTLLEARLAAARHQVSALITQVSRRSLDLRPTLLDDMGLRTALAWYLERYTEQTGIAVTFQESGLESRVAPPVELTAYRIVQEALTNVARHAEATAATVQVWVVNGRLLIQVEDAGRGFDVAMALEAHASSGLAGMCERARLLGGELRIESELGIGTRLLADLPTGGVPRTIQEPS